MKQVRSVLKQTGKRIQRDRRASILVLVVWALGLLTVLAICIGFGVRQRLAFVGRITLRNELRLIATAGIERALAELHSSHDESAGTGLGQAWAHNPKLFQSIVLNQGAASVYAHYARKDFVADATDNEDVAIRYGMTDEQGKININQVQLPVLVRLLEEAAQVCPEPAQKLAAAIIDWRDEDNQPLPNGAEDQYYHGVRSSYECKDGPFESLEELRYVRGMSASVLRQIIPYVTINGSGKININTASATVLAALGIDDSVCRKILQVRCGKDGVPATPDDYLFTATSSIVPVVSQIAALSAAEAALLSNVVAQGGMVVRSDVFLIESTAQIPPRKGRCRVRCIAHRSGQKVVVKDWRVQFAQ